MRQTARRLPLLAVVIFSPLLLAQPAKEPAPLDPAHVVTQFRRAYHKRAFVESLDITVRTASERKRETVTVRGNVKGELRLELGDLIVWTEPKRLVAVHRLNAGVYFEVPLEDGDRAACIAKALPPLPVPQIALALQGMDAPASSWSVSPLCPSPHWDSATAATHDRKPAVVLSGTSEHATVRVAGVGDPPVLVFAETRSTHDDLTTTITAEIARLDEPVGRIECDLRGREPVAALTDLRAVTPDVRAGLAMPDLLAEPLERRDADQKPMLIPAAKACVLLIFSADAPDIDPLLRSVHDTAAKAGVPFRMLCACSLTDTKARDVGIAAMEKIDARGGFVSYSPSTTLARFAPAAAPAPQARAVAVVIDKTGLVQGVLPSSDTGMPETLRGIMDRCK